MITNKKLLSIFSLAFTCLSSIYAQKELTLKDAITQQYRGLYPKGVTGLRWIPGSNNYSYITSWGTDGSYTSINAASKDSSTLISYEDLNLITEDTLKRLPYLTFYDNGYASFRIQQKLYSVNLNSKTGELLLELPQNASNTDYNPETNQIAYTIGNNLYFSNKEGAFNITKNEDKNIVSGQSIARNEFGITKGTFWSPDGKTIAFYQKDESQVNNYPLVDINAYPAALNNIKYPMAGLGSEKASVGVYNTISKTLIYLEIEGTEDQYITNLSWTLDNKYISVAILNREQNHMWLNIYDAKNGKFIKTLFEETHNKYVEPENPAYFIEGTNNEFLWMSERDGYTHIYHYNFEGKLLNKVTEGDFETLSILDYHTKTKKVTYSRTSNNGLDLVSAQKLISGKGKESIFTSESGYHKIQISSDGSYAIDDFSSLSTARKIQTIETKKSKISIIKESEDPLKEYKAGHIKLGSILAADGKTSLNTRMILPSNFDSTQKYPVLVYVYGGPHAQLINNRYRTGASLWMNYFAEQGYIVFTVDNRGSAHRGFEFENVIHRQLGEVEMADQLEGVKFLKSLSYVDTERMAVDGWSFGGFMTTSLMLRHPGVFKVGVAGGPVTDWKLYEVMYGERYMDTPKENPEGYERAALNQYVTNLKGNLLLIHGSVDPVVVPQHSMSLIKSFVDNEVQMDFFTYPMHEHNVLGKDRYHLFEKILNYIDEKINE